MNILNNIEKNIIGDKTTALLSYSKFINFYSYIDSKQFDLFLNNIINDYRLHKIKNILDNNKLKNNSKIILIGIGGYGQIYKLNNYYCIKINIINNPEYHEYLIGKKIAETSPVLKNLIVEPVAMIKKKKLDGLTDIINIHIIFIYILYCFLLNKNLSTSKIKTLLETYNITEEYNELYQSKYKKVLKQCIKRLFDYYFPEKTKIILIDNFLSIIKSLKKKNKINTEGFLILMPLAKTISTNIFLNPSLKSLDLNGIKAYKVYSDINRMIFLQTALFILIVNKTYKFCHNDLKPDNILAFPEFNTYSIEYKNLIFIFNELFRFKIADFDFAVIHNIIDNQKILKSKLPYTNNWFTDIHFFVHHLFLFLPYVEIEVDEIFFKKIHEIFIFPYCSVPFKQMRKNTIVKSNKSILCYNGRIDPNLAPKINILENFLTTNFFKKWNKNKNESNIINYDNTIDTKQKILKIKTIQTKKISFNSFIFSD